MSFDAHEDSPSLFVHFLMLSLLSIGGAISTTPEMHRFLVEDMRWLDDQAFSQSIALAQAAPGPNLLFVPILGYRVGGALGATLATLGMLLPSSVLSLTATRWAARHREHRWVKAFQWGMAPVTLGLMVSTCWVLSRPCWQAAQQQHHVWPLLVFFGAALWSLARTRTPAWAWMAAAGLMGALGWL